MWFHSKVPTVIRHRFTSSRVTTLSTTLLLMLISCYVTHMATSLEILTGSAADGSGRVVPAHQPLGESGHAAFSLLRRDDDDAAFARLGSIPEVPFRPLEVFRRQDFPHLTLRSPATPCGCPACHSVCVCVSSRDSTCVTV